jgi:phosphohistidine phosphatase SixA
MAGAKRLFLLRHAKSSWDDPQSQEEAGMKLRRIAALSWAKG